MILSLIVAVAENGAIGANNQLLWNLPLDMKHFRETTKGHAVIMGRKTFESIGHPLPKRRNIIITRDANLKIEGCEAVVSLQDALQCAEKGGEAEAFIIGGGQIYAQALPTADRVYLTRVHTESEGDTFFPEFPTEEWIEVSREDHEADSEHRFPFTFLVYERRK
ncbi:MAG: dihydrofolate reductase [Candidatus Peribacteraceae bacterium]|nr:dihydrofolate reductase [Candidatus Peribacteraceae bacterium]MDD5075317.1 dihydrofolate reductase [Candidatus Peribacteraceae bacterium]